MTADADSATDALAFVVLEGVDVDEAGATGIAAAGVDVDEADAPGIATAGVDVDGAGAPGIDVAAVGRVLATIMVTSTKLVAQLVSKRLTSNTQLTKASVNTR